jgi:threonine dehydrogenase-like Zn-dependent dehydrogenase
VPGEPLGCAVNIFQRSEIRAGQTVAIVGIGFLGALLTQLATHADARVIAMSRRPFSLEFAKQAAPRTRIAAGRPLEDPREGEGASPAASGASASSSAPGLQWPLDLAGEMTAERGRLVIAGYHQDGMRQVNLQLWNWRGIDVINAHERDPQRLRRRHEARRRR